MQKLTQQASQMSSHMTPKLTFYTPAAQMHQLPQTTSIMHCNHHAATHIPHILPCLIPQATSAGADDDSGSVVHAIAQLALISHMYIINISHTAPCTHSSCKYKLDFHFFWILNLIKEMYIHIKLNISCSTDQYYTGGEQSVHPNVPAQRFEQHFQIRQV